MTDIRTPEDEVDKPGYFYPPRVVAGIVGFGGLIWILQLVATAKVLP